MTNGSSSEVSPLRKRTPDSELYKRTAEIEGRLAALKLVPRAEVLEQCQIRDRNHPDYVPSECLMYLVRDCRSDNSGSHFERLYKLLSARVLQALPSGENSKSNSLDLKSSKVRERAFDRFTELLAMDRRSYDERLDFYEVRFDGAVANLRTDAKRTAFKEANRTQTLEFDDESGELTAEVELAVRGYAPFDSPESSNEDYRLRLEQAIAQLKPEQIRIVHMLQLGTPIDSKEEGVVTISKTLRKSEKTIRNQRDKAFAAIRLLLAKDQS